MTLLAVPNLSEGRDAQVIEALQRAVEGAGARILDTHSDPVHNRTVLTVTAADEVLVEAMVHLATSAAELIDLDAHQGVHPRVGVLDVCPFVPYDDSLETAVEAARAAARRIGDEGVPVFLYGAGGAPPLPEIRRGGLDGLVERVGAGLAPDYGPSSIEPRTGVVCVGARGPLIAFNVNFDGDLETAKAIAVEARADTNLPGLRALGFVLPRGSQVSMNITRPEEVGIDDVFASVESVANRLGTTVVSSEIVGLVEQRYLPDPNAKAARLLIEPGRSVESALRS